MYRKVNTDMNFVEREKEVLKFWKENDIFNKSIENRKQGPVYTFYDGPPTANGKPHIGHVETRVIKDMIPRYRTMKGYQVPRKAGWDTHGLPVELEVEKAIGINGKDQIEKYGIEPFVKKCKDSVWKYKGMWEEFSDAVGFWADMEHPYVTYYNDFIESEWWALKTIWDKGLLYKGYKIVPYCPRCGTPLSSHEVAQGYKTVKEKSVMAKFRLCGEENVYFIAWTTTPWTLPSNVALAVNPKETYVKAEVSVNEKGRVLSTDKDEKGETSEQGEVHTEYYILAEALLNVIEGDYKVVATYTGKQLEYMKYEPLFEYAYNDKSGSRNPLAGRDNVLGKKAYYVVCADYVTLTDGTGIVHIAPAFGADDSEVGRNYDLPFLQLVDEKGCMKPEVTDMAGLFVKKADEPVMKLLAEKKLLFKILKFEHDYPFCWRCDTPLIYYARETWFIKMTAVKDKMIANNEKINWIPESIGKGRFGDWLENIVDWGISRNRYWGTPLNIWTCECGNMVSVGSIKELKELSDNCPDEIELHRPYIDAVTIKCPKCGKTMHRVPEVIDCWFDSGAMPYAQHHYPFENRELFEKQFPASFISEAVDQTRGWFYSLLAESTLLFDKPAYNNVIVLGLVLDENGQKMSKSKGNAVDPMDALNKFGADAIRWYFYINSAPWLPNRFHDKAVQEYERKFMGTLWNTYAFYILYAGIDNFDATKYSLDYSKLCVMDKWLLSRVNSAIKEADADLDTYKIPEAAKVLADFVDEMSNWYVRRGRERFWAKGMEQDKINAYMTLYTALVDICKAAAPMIPFMTESIYQNLVRGIDDKAPISIHLCDYPVCEEKYVDKKLEEDMGEVLNIVVLGRACRNEANTKQRQPLKNMYVKADEKADSLSGFYKDIIEDELNVKNVIFTDDVSSFTSYSFKPNLHTLGKVFGKSINDLKNLLSQLDGAKAMEEINNSGSLEVTLDGTKHVIAKEDLLIEAKKTEGYVAAEDGGYTVVIDTNLTPELIEEGFVREVISKVQTMRKEAGFEVMDRITLYQSGSEIITDAMKKNSDSIKKIVLAEEIVYGSSENSDGYTKEWDLNGQKAVLTVIRK
jgi:isoleucyl-tRNA synthetase